MKSYQPVFFPKIPILHLLGIVHSDDGDAAEEITDILHLL
jgi:hypothetical protein